MLLNYLYQEMMPGYSVEEVTASVVGKTIGILSKLDELEAYDATFQEMYPAIYGKLNKIFTLETPLPALCQIKEVKTLVSGLFFAREALSSLPAAQRRAFLEKFLESPTGLMTLKALEKNQFAPPRCGHFCSEEVFTRLQEIMRIYSAVKTPQRHGLFVLPGHAQLVQMIESHRATLCQMSMVELEDVLSSLKIKPRMPVVPMLQ